MKFSERTILVMSGSKGLGRGVVEAAVEAGMQVHATGSNQERLDMLKSEVDSDRLTTHELDIFDRKQVGRIIETIGSVKPDSLIINIPGPKPGTVLDIPEAEWKRHADSVLIHPVLIATEAVKHMRLKAFGRIVAITSTSIRQPIENLVLSNCYRSALTSWLNSLAKEVAADGVTVNAAAPGFTKTGRAEQLAKTMAEKQGISVEEVEKRRNSALPAGRPARVEEFVAAVMFLLSAQASYVNGVTLPVDGGKIAFPF